MKKIFLIFIIFIILLILVTLLCLLFPQGIFSLQKKGLASLMIDNSYTPPPSYYDPNTPTIPYVSPNISSGNAGSTSGASSAVADTPRSGCPTGLVPCGGKTCPCTLCDFFVMFKNIIDDVVFKIVPLVAILMILIGGFMYVIAFINPSEGGSEMVNRAKSVFKSVVIGLFIVFGAWLIVNLFFQVIGVAPWTGLQGGWQIINCN